jgi:hypothetical protein
MNPRVTAALVGSIIVALGLAGLLYPERVMGLLGFTVPSSSRTAAAFGEVRATYGGLFVVMGVYTLLTAFDPATHRARLLFIGLMWLGAAAGRLFGAYVDGNPGLPGWLGVGFELVMGGALVAAAQTAVSRAEIVPATVPSPGAPSTAG